MNRNIGPISLVNDTGHDVWCFIWLSGSTDRENYVNCSTERSIQQRKQNELPCQVHNVILKKITEYDREKLM